MTERLICHVEQSRDISHCSLINGKRSDQDYRST
jgi:hypothetical protein